MKETRKIFFENLVFKKNDIKKICKYFSDLVIHNRSKLSPRSKIFLDFEDGYSREIVNDKIPNDILDDRKLLKIYILYICCRGDENDDLISVSIKENSYSSITVESSNKDWCSSKFVEIETIFNSINPQNTIYKKYKNSLLLYLSVAVGYLVLPTIVSIFDSVYKIYGAGSSCEHRASFMYFIEIFLKVLEKDKIAKFLISFIAAVALGRMLIFEVWKSLDLYLSSAWPSIEFAFGPEHKRRAKKQRNAIIFVVLQVILPLVFSILKF